MATTIKSLSDKFEAVPVIVKSIVDYDGYWLSPGDSMELTKEQAASDDVKAHKDAGRVTVSAGSDSDHKKVENVSNVIVYFDVPDQKFDIKQQVVIPPNASIVIPDEQANSPEMREFLESGKADNPDDDLVIKGGSGKMYKTIAAALSGGESEVKLMSNYNRQTVISSGKSLTLDLNGYAMKYSTHNFKVTGELTIKGNGSIESTRSYAIWVDNGGKLMVEGGEIKAVEGCVCFPGTVGGEVVIEGGEFTCSDNAVIIANGSKQYGGNKCTVNGGIFNGKIKSAGYIACGIYCPNNDEFTVNGGTFNIEGGCGVCARAGKVAVNGGTFNTTGNVTGKVGDSRVVVPCSALVFDTDANYPNLTDDAGIVVKGGTFVSEVACVANVGEDRITVEGGDFTPAL